MIADANLFIGHLHGVSDATDFLSRHADIAIPFVVVAELLTGAALARRPDESERRVNDLVEVFPVIWPDLDTATRFARLSVQLRRAGTPIGVHDMWSAALALQLNLPIVSNDSDFEQVPGLKVIRWSTATRG